MRDIVVLATLILTFALAVTTHVLIVAGLAVRRRGGRAALALVVPPLAPAWAYAQGMKARAIVWVVAVVTYGATWIVART